MHGKPPAQYSDQASVFRLNNKNATAGDGYTQFGRAMHELNIQTLCANTSSAKGRANRWHFTAISTVFSGSTVAVQLRLTPLRYAASGFRFVH